MMLILKRLKCTEIGLEGEIGVSPGTWNEDKN